MLRSMYRTRGFNSAINLLCTGLFSDPAASRFDVLYLLYEQGQLAYVVSVLAELSASTQRAMKALRQRYRDERFMETLEGLFQEQQLGSPCLLAMLAACSCLNEDRASEPMKAETLAQRVVTSISRLEAVLRDKPEHFDRVFRVAFTVMAQHLLAHGGEEQSPREMLKDVTRIAGIQFRELVSNMRVQICLDESR
jgi:hypothetical protein